MNSFDVSEMAKQIGLSVRNNLIVSDRFQYGRIGESQIYLNDGSDRPTISLDNFDSFSCENRGSGDLSVSAHSHLRH